MVCSRICRVLTLIPARGAWSVMYSLNEASASRRIAFGLIIPAFFLIRQSLHPTVDTHRSTHLLTMLEYISLVERSYPPPAAHFDPHVLCTSPPTQRGETRSSFAYDMGECAAVARDLADFAAVEDGEADCLVLVRFVLRCAGVGGGAVASPADGRVSGGEETARKAEGSRD